MDDLELFEKIHGITMGAMRGGHRCEVQRAARYDFVNDSEWAKASASVDGMIMGKLRLTKFQIRSLDGFTNKTVQKITERAIHDFGLSVNLWMVRATVIKPGVC